MPRRRAVDRGRRLGRRPAPSRRARPACPVDFVTTHTYGAPPLDLRPILARYGRADLPLWWTEWGVSPTHGAPVNDSVWGAPLVARGMRSAAGRLDALAYWVASDQFVELGVPEQLFHGGFGLLTVGDLRKPRFWAIAILEQLGDEELASRGRRATAAAASSRRGRAATRSDGDASRSRSGTARSTRRRPAATTALDRARDAGRRRGSRRATYRVEHRRVDDDALEHRPHLGGAGRRRLADGGPVGAAPRGATGSSRSCRTSGSAVGSDGVARLAFDLPMPAISFVEIRPAN